MQEITVQEFKLKQASDASLIVIDVREAWEFDEDNIGARLLPLGDLPLKLAEISDLKDKEVIVHCRSGARSARAQKYLMSQGFSNVINLAGGILAYRESE